MSGIEKVGSPENTEFKPSRITVVNPAHTLTFIRQVALSDEKESPKAYNSMICPSLEDNRFSLHEAEGNYKYRIIDDSCIILLREGRSSDEKLVIAGHFDKKNYGISLSNEVDFEFERPADKESRLQEKFKNALTARFRDKFALSEDSTEAVTITTSHGFTFALNSFSVQRVHVPPDGKRVRAGFDFAVSTAKIRELRRDTGLGKTERIVDLQDNRIVPVTAENIQQYLADIALIYDQAREVLGDFGIILPAIEAEIISRPKKEAKMTDEIRAALGDVSENFVIEDPRVRFADVIGHHEILTQLKDVISALKDPQARHQLLDLPSGVLLHGLPGCGKTYLTKAVATESGCRFLYIQPSMLFDMRGATDMIRVLFEEIREEEKPTMIFVDEADTFFRKRDLLSQPRAEVVSTFLAHLDGIGRSNKAFLILASNRPDLIDSAMYRSGRIDFKLEVKPPASGDRMALFRFFISQVGTVNDNKFDPKIFDPSLFEGTDAISRLAVVTATLGPDDILFTQADIRAVVGNALLKRFNTEGKPPVTLDNLLAAIEELRNSRISPQKN